MEVSFQSLPNLSSFVVLMTRLLDMKVESFACCPIALYCNIYIFMADPCDLEVEYSFLL